MHDRSWRIHSGFNLSGVDICRGDTLPEVEDTDCVILGGTMHVVTEDRPWLHALYAWLRQYRATKKPLLGIVGYLWRTSTGFDAV